MRHAANDLASALGVEGVHRILASMRGFLYVVSLKDGGLTKYQYPSIRQFVGTDASENIDNPAYCYSSFIYPDDRAGADKLFNDAMAEKKGFPASAPLLDRVAALSARVLHSRHCSTN